MSSSLTTANSGGAGGSAILGGGGGGGISINSSSGTSGAGGQGGNSTQKGGGGGGGCVDNTFVAATAGDGGGGGSSYIGGGGGGGGRIAAGSSQGGNGGASILLGGGGGGGPNNYGASGSSSTQGGNGGNAYIGGGGGGGACVGTTSGVGGIGGASTIGGGGGGGAPGGTGGTPGAGGNGGFGGGDGGTVDVLGDGGSALGGAVFICTGGSLLIADGTFTGNFLGSPGTGASSGIAQGSDMYLMTGSRASFLVSVPQIISGTIAGSGGLILSGTSILTLSGTNTYSGSTTVNQGTLKVGIASAYPSSSSLFLANSAGAIFDVNNFNLTISSLSGGGSLGGNVALGPTTLTLGNNTNTTYSGVISGTGGLIKQGSGIFTLAGANTYSGSTTVNAGTLQAGANNAFSSNSVVFMANVAGAALDLNTYNETIASLSGGGSTGGNVNLGSGILTLGGDNTNAIYSGVISGGGGLTKQGTGYFALIGTNTYSGQTTISSGQLIFVGDTSQLTGNVSNAGLLAFEQTKNSSFSGAISGTGTFFLVENATLVLSGGNTYSGTTTITSGTLQAGANNTFSPNSTIVIANAAAAALDLNTSNQTIGSLSGGGGAGGNVSLGGTLSSLTLGGNNQSTTYSGIISGGGSLTKQGSGNFVLTAINTYAATTTISGGMLTFSADTSTLSGDVVDNAALVFNQTVNSSLSGVISGAGTVMQAGNTTLTLSGTNTYTGTTTISSGTLIFTKDTSNVTGNMIDNGVLIFDQTHNSTFSGIISGSGILTQNGIATLTLSGSNLYSGTTTISSGALAFSGDTSQMSGNVIDNGSLIFNQSTNSTFSGQISGIGTVIQSGSATLTLSVTNTYSGITTISSGSLAFAEDTSGLGGNIIDRGSLIFSQAENSTFGGIISGTGTVTQDGTATLNLSGNNTYQGTTTIASGTLVFSGNTSGLGGNIVDNGSLVFDQAADSTFALAISGSGTVTKFENTTLTFTGTNNTYSGTTTVVGGTLQAGAVRTFSPNSLVVLANTAGVGLSLNGFDQTILDLSGGGASGGNVSLGLGTLTLGGNNVSTTYSGVISGGGGLVKQGSGDFFLTGANTYAGTTTILSGTLTFLGDTSGLDGNLIDDSALVFDQTSNSSFSGLISGVGTVTQSGSATLILAGDNTYSGTTSILSGTLTFTGDTSGLGGNIVDSSSLVFVQASNSSYSGVISGTGQVTLDSGGVFTLFGANTYTGDTYIYGGSLQAGGPGVFSSASAVITENYPGAALDLNGFDQTIASLAGGGTVGGNVTLGSGTLTLGGNNTITLFSGGISGAGGLNKVGSGIFTLGGVDNTYFGVTSVHQGVFRAAIMNAFSPNSAVVLDNVAGVLLDLNSFDQTIGSLAGGGSIGGNVNLGSATLTLGGNGTSTNYAGSIFGSGGITKQGIGTFKLSGVNTYLGPTTINEGVLLCRARDTLSASSSVVLANNFGAKLDLNGFDQTIGSLAGGGHSGGNVSLGSGRLTLGGDNTSTTYFGTISGAGGITKEGSGVFTLAGVNTYLGSTDVHQGTLQAGAVDAFSPSSAVIISNGALLDLNNFNQTIASLEGGGNVSLVAAELTLGGNNRSTTYSGVIEGGGSVTKIGSGTFTLTNANTFTGVMTVSNGVLNLQGSVGGNAIIDAFALIKGTGTVVGSLIVNNQGIVSPGNSIGTLNVGGYINNGGIYEVEIDGAGQSDLINCSGAAEINGGTVIVTSIDGVYDLAYKYTIVTAGSVTGIYSDAVSTSPLISPVLSYDPQHVYLLVDVNFISGARTCNQIAVANQIDTIFYPNAYQKPLLKTLLGLSVQGIQETLNQLSGQQHTNDFFSTQVINRGFIRRLYDPVRYIVTTKPLTQSFYHPCYGWEYDTNYNKFDVWVESGAGCTHVYDTKSARGFHLNGYEITFGIQRGVAPNWTIGLAGSYESDDILYNCCGRGKSKTLLGGIYGVYRPKNYYVLTNIAYGYSKNSMRRSVSAGSLAYEMYSRPNIGQTTLYGEVGVDFASKNYMVQPFAGLEVSICNRQRFVETGESAWNLVVDKKQRGTVNTRLGVHLKVNKLPYKSAINLDLAWNKRLTDSNNSVSEKFVGFGNTFNINGVDVDRSSLECDITASTCFLRGWRFYVEGGAELWNRAYNLNILGGVEFTW